MKTILIILILVAIPLAIREFVYKKNKKPNIDNSVPQNPNSRPGESTGNPREEDGDVGSPHKNLPDD